MHAAEKETVFCTLHVYILLDHHREDNQKEKHYSLYKRNYNKEYVKEGHEIQIHLVVFLHGGDTDQGITLKSRTSEDIPLNASRPQCRNAALADHKVEQADHTSVQRLWMMSTHSSLPWWFLQRVKVSFYHIILSVDSYFLQTGTNQSTKEWRSFFSKLLNRSQLSV